LPDRTERAERVELTHSPRRLGMTGICAFLPLHRDRRRAGIRAFDTIERRLEPT
jgi:hypothetical protein